MEVKKRLLGTFIRLMDGESEIEKIVKTINIIATKLSMDKKEFYVYRDLDDNTQFVITYNITLEPGNHVKFNEIFKNTIPVNKSKTGCIYTINALNKLIEELSQAGGNTDHKTFKVDWEQYQNTLMLLKGDTLLINRIKRIFM